MVRIFIVFYPRESVSSASSVCYFFMFPGIVREPIVSRFSDKSRNLFWGMYARAWCDEITGGMQCDSGPDAAGPMAQDAEQDAAAECPHDLKNNRLPTIMDYGIGNQMPERETDGAYQNNRDSLSE